TDPRGRTRLLLVALGGMLGASARYAFIRRFATHGDGIPWATFWVNVGGSFVLGLVLGLTARRPTSAPSANAFLATGVLGAFTTMSALQVESLVRIKDGHMAMAVAYELASVAVGLALAFAAARMVRR